MLNTILSSLRYGTPRVLPNWDKTVITIKLRTEIMKTRYLGTGFVYNPGTNLLVSILQSMVNSKVLNCKSDFKRYVEFIDPSIPIYRNYFDPVYSSRLTKGVFLSNSSIPEYILNVSMEKPLTDLPMDKPWSAWKNLIPTHIIYHDSKELVSDLCQFRIKFDYDQPHSIFYSIDLTMLSFMYIKYIEYCQEMSLSYSVESFLQEHVFIHWFDDLRRIWLFNILKTIVANKFEYNKFKSNDLIAPIVMLKTIGVDLYRMIDDARHRAVSIDDICATAWFGTVSLRRWLVELNTNLKLPSLRQYKWLEFTSTLPYAMFILDTMLLIGRADVNPLVRKLIWDLHMYENQDICSNIHNTSYRAYVERELQDVLKRVEHIRHV